MKVQKISVTMKNQASRRESTKSSTSVIRKTEASYESKRKRCFQDHWKNDFKWLSFNKKVQAKCITSYARTIQPWLIKAALFLQRHVTFILVPSVSMIFQANIHVNIISTKKLVMNLTGLLFWGAATKLKDNQLAHLKVLYFVCTFVEDCLLQ